MNDIYSIAAKIAVLYPCDTIRHIAGKIADIRAQSVGGLELEMQWSPGHRKNPIVRQFCEFVGIILCQSADKPYVEYAIRDYNKPLGVATYRTADEMPENLKRALPPIDELRKQLEIADNRQA